MNLGASGKSSHSQLLEALKRMNFNRATTGLLCLQETVDPGENSHDINGAENTNHQKVPTESDTIETPAKTTDSTSAKNIHSNSTSNAPTRESSGKLDLVGQVKKTVGRNKVIANKCKVFVGNVGFKVRRREFREFFGYFGKVLSAEIIEDKAKRRSRGFGFVTFSNEWEAQKAKDSTDDERMLNGRVMTVSTPTRRRKGGREPFEEEQSLEDVLEEFKQLSLMQETKEDVHTESTSNKTEKSVPSFSSLNEDILIHIFTFLGLKDKIQIERVCRKWKYLVLKAWPSVTHLDFKDIFSLYKGGLTDYILLKILQRGCKNLQSLDLSASPFLLTDFAVHCIAKHCKSLKRIDLSEVKLTTSSLKVLSKSCNKLEILILRRSGVGEKGFWWVFKECRHLKYIDVSDNKRLTGKCFFMLPPTVETLILSDCSRLTDSGTTFVGNICNNLKTIDMSGCASLTNAAFTALLNCTKVETFRFKNCPQTVNGEGLEMMISRFANLMKLDLSGCDAVNDNLLFHIGRCSTNLNSLNIQDCSIGDVSDAGLQSLVTCEKLQELIISYNDHITNASISQLALNGTLRIFIARSCDGMTDGVVESLLTRCTNLAELDLSGCIYITDASLLHVINYYTSPVDRCLLTLVIGGTSISDDRIDQAIEECQGVKIVTHDFSTDHPKARNQRIAMPQFFLDSDEEDGDDDDDQSQNEHDFGAGDEYDDFLLADDPSMMDEQEWMFN